jgi:hypothetical protein
VELTAKIMVILHEEERRLKTRTLNASSLIPSLYSAYSEPRHMRMCCVVTAAICFSCSLLRADLNLNSGTAAAVLAFCKKRFNWASLLRKNTVTAVQRFCPVIGQMFP